MTPMKALLAGASIALALVAPLAPVHAQTLRWASAGDPQTMDPHSQNESMTNMMNGQVYERLTRRDRQLKIVPGLATEWQQVGPLTWRFKLRQGVKFHDGSPLTADDVVYSVQRGQMPTSQINNYAAGVGTATTPASTGVKMPPRIPPRMMTGVSSAQKASRKVVHSLRPSNGSTAL